MKNISLISVIFVNSIIVGEFQTVDDENTLTESDNTNEKFTGTSLDISTLVLLNDNNYHKTLWGQDDDRDTIMNEVDAIMLNDITYPDDCRRIKRKEFVDKTLKSIDNAYGDDPFYSNYKDFVHSTIKQMLKVSVPSELRKQVVDLAKLKILHENMCFPRSENEVNVILESVISDIYFSFSPDSDYSPRYAAACLAAKTIRDELKSLPEDDIFDKLLEQANTKAKEILPSDDYEEVQKDIRKHISGFQSSLKKDKDLKSIANTELAKNVLICSLRAVVTEYLDALEDESYTYYTQEEVDNIEDYIIETRSDYYSYDIDEYEGYEIAGDEEIEVITLDSEYDPDYTNYIHSYYGLYPSYEIEETEYYDPYDWQ